ncbi:beta-lactamase/transpeptidase-like protein [Mycotypha africana]|uniref:beta-lactamase/transpeptidase-like protein n=1 Tax=Mycotypha africana TaxID=64632 RepID=UPI0023019DE9|nr:beta-lactamase/transpeptidase-like protein [Mycotypha africana]KAI8991551.1 beta-lactamase/transpeptidase-like protein [Mycotypha africana]
MLSWVSFVTLVIPITSYILYQAVNKAPFLSLSCAITGFVNCPPSNIPIHGFIADEYEPVKDIFINNFRKGLDVGAGLSVYVDGQQVIDLYGGWRDREKGIEYTNETIQMVFSSTKALSAIIIAQMVDQGILDYDEKISTYWPEFAQGNKENVTLMDLMRHTAGVGGFDLPLNYSVATDPERFAQFLAAQPHNFNGTPIHSYHAISQGWYQNEILKRVDPTASTPKQGRTIDDYAHAFNDIYHIEWYLKPDATEGPEVIQRIAPYYEMSYVQKMWPTLRTYLDPRIKDKSFVKSLFDKDSMYTKTLIHPKVDQYEGVINNKKPKYRVIEGPSYSGHSNARSMAKLGAMMANKGKAIVNGEPDLFKNPSTFEEATKLLTEFEIDSTLPNIPMVNERGGFLMFTRDSFNLSDPEAYFEGGCGAGGSLFFYNQKYKIALGYTTNAYYPGGEADVRTIPIVEAIFEIVKKNKKDMNA